MHRIVSSILSFGGGEAIFPCLPTFFPWISYVPDDIHLSFSVSKGPQRVRSLSVFYLISSEDIKYRHAYMNSTSSFPFLSYSETWWGLFRHQIVDGRWISPSCRWFPDIPGQVSTAGGDMGLWALRYTLSLIHGVTGWLRLPHSGIWFSYL